MKSLDLKKSDIPTTYSFDFHYLHPTHHPPHKMEHIAQLTDDIALIHPSPPRPSRNNFN